MSINIEKFAVVIILLFSYNLATAQAINFGSTGLTGANINNPTSLDFGPNNKLYVSQQDGTIWEYEVSRDNAAAGEGSYSILSTNEITLIKNNTPNHNDDGTFNSTQTRQITGLLATGTAANPVLYVTSSDSRIGGGGGAGNDVNLDTNSGVLSRLTWDGTNWNKVDLVRGLPRCEENHSTNGLDLFVDGGNTYLLMQVGGNTNQGAPSNNFAGSSEFYLSGALLIVNITQLEQMEAANGGPYLDPRTSNSPYIYDLPSINDPERQDIDNTHPSFPYTSPSHPMYNATIDLGDPFGGNNGLNQTFPENGGPVQIFSPGFRNAYDVVITADGRIFTGDNGPNGGWGGAPLIYDSNDQLKGTHNSTTYDANAGDYVTNEFNIENGQSLGDALHYVGTVNDANNTYYAGHPNPIRAFPDKAGVYKYEYNGSNWVENGSYDWANLITGVQGYFNASGFTISDFPIDDRQGEYLLANLNSPKVNVLDVISSSTNGICEYTASNFSGAMQGDILTASFNGNINRYELNPDGTTLLSQDNGFLNGFGSIPLDLIALNDTSMFPGTIWVVTYGANDITIFEPGDFGDCFAPGDLGYVGTEDYDNDGFTNADEIDNGTNHCSAGSSPTDNDGDFISDLNDPDDDNDGIPDNQDVFAIDAQNGLTTNLPIDYPFWNNDPGTGLFGLGFTGLQLDPSGNTNYLTQYDPVNLSFGGAGGKATVDAVSSGDALNAQNTQENAFQFGINVDSNSNPFTIYSKIETPFNGSAPLPTQSYGIYIGNGDQDNYLKVAIQDGTVGGDSTYGFEVVSETNGISSASTFDAPGILQAASVDLYISVNPVTNTAQIFYSLDAGITIIGLGGSYTLPSSFLNPNDSVGMAVGIIGTSGSSGSTFNAVWDFIKIVEDTSSSLASQTATLDFGQSNINSSANELSLEVTNIGNPADGPIEISQVNVLGADASLFTSGLTVPISVGPQAEVLIPVTFTPDNISGLKSASLEIIHDGVNSPLIIQLSAELLNNVSTPIVRIAAGSANDITNTDGGPDWESNPSQNAYSGVSYSVNTGNIGDGEMLYGDRHSSIPSYIDQNTFNGIFNEERWDEASGPEMEFSIPVASGDYTVNLYLGNSFAGTADPDDRIFDIVIEGVTVENNLDLIEEFGHRVAGMLTYNVTVSDGVLSIGFEHVTENPLINAIEVIQEALLGNQAPNAVASANTTSGVAPLDVIFSGSSSTDDNNDIVSYDWDFGNGDTASGETPSYTYTNPGSYTVTLTVTDGGGLTDTDTLLIDVAVSGSCQWNNLSNSNFEKLEAQSAKVGDKLYVISGFLNNLVNTDVIEIYNTTTDVWSTGTPIPLAVTHMGVTVVGTDIWVVGGFAGNHPGVATNLVQIYNTVTDSWSNGPALPAPRGSGAAVFNNGKIHFFGGLLPDRVTDTDEHYILDINNQGLGWVAAAALPNGRNHLSGASFNGLVYAIGGQHGHDNENLVVDQDDLDVYDPSTDTWSSLADLPTARSHFEPGTIVHNGKIVIVGGRTGANFFYDEIIEYDPINNVWTDRCDLPEKLLAPAAKVFNDRLIVANGGENGIDNLSDATRWLPIEAEFAPLVLDPIADQTDFVGDSSSLAVSANGGDPNGNVTYSISGQPDGLSVEPTNGQIIGSIEASALNGGPSNDGVHIVTVTATKPYSEDTTLQFTWTVPNDGLIYDGSTWAPYAPDNTTGSDNAYVLSGQYSNTTDIEINALYVQPGASIIIEPGHSIRTNGDITVSGNGFIELRSTAITFSSLIPNGTVSGNVLYKRHVNTNDALQGGIGGNDLIAPPLSGEAFMDFATSNTNIVSNNDDTLFLFGPFNKVNGSYDIYANTETATLNEGIGYRAASTDAGTFTFTGTVNTGSIAIPISVSGPAFAEWNLIGNPYPSYINLSAFLNTNSTDFGTTSAALYGYDGDTSDGWVVLNQAYADENPLDLIAPGQGFFVASKAGGGTVNFEPSMRSIGQSDDYIPMRPSVTSSHLKLNLTQNDKRYSSDFYFNPNASRGLDKGYDAQVWGGNSANFSIHSYLVEDNTGLGLPMAIQSLSQTDYADVRIPLGINANIGEQLSISIAESTLPNTVEVYLEDQLTQTTVLLNNNDFVFTPSNTLNDSGRFFLRFNDITLSNETSDLENLSIYSNHQNQTIIFSGLISEPTIAKLYDVQGRLVISSSLKLNVNLQDITVNGLDKGVYVLSLEGSTQKLTKKLILK